MNNKNIEIIMSVETEKDEYGDKQLYIKMRVDDDYYNKIMIEEVFKEYMGGNKYEDVKAIMNFEKGKMIIKKIT